jgi:hypothetical protein
MVCVGAFRVSVLLRLYDHTGSPLAFYKLASDGLFSFAPQPLPSTFDLQKLFGKSLKGCACILYFVSRLRLVSA